VDNYSVLYGKNILLALLITFDVSNAILPNRKIAQMRRVFFEELVYY